MLVHSTWRATQAIPALEAAQVTFYDPQVKDWKPALMVLESLMKVCVAHRARPGIVPIAYAQVWCRVLLFVIGDQTRALASMIEAAALIGQGRHVVLVMNEMPAGAKIDGQVGAGSVALVTDGCGVVALFPVYVLRL
jgi:hypothetical protein